MSKITKQILNRVEGEIQLKLIWEDGKIIDAYIIAPNFRGFEFILKGKPPLDALVITPRICGICGHAHLIATTDALENLYRNCGINLEISPKAKLIRKITLSCEIVQNHIRWFYLFVFPDLLKLEKKENLSDFVPVKGKKWRKAVDFSSKIVKIISIFGGQWPHTSYSLPGGVMCDPTNVEISEAISIVDSVFRYFEEDIIGMSFEDYMQVRSLKEFLDRSNGDLALFLKVCKRHYLHKTGKSYNRFISISDIGFESCIGVTNRKKRQRFELSKIKEVDTFSYLSSAFSFDKQKYSWAKAVRYNGLPYETGPLARQINIENPLFINLNKKFRDSYLVRIWARVDEIGKLLFSIKKCLLELNIKEPSFINPPVDLKQIEGEGYGLVEAARGSLIHKVNLKEGKIYEYDIITPSVWNLGPRCKRYLSPAEKAIKGLKSELVAHMVLRSFDVCSVCTTH